MFGLRGGRLAHPFPDFSHLGLGSRHRGGLLPLPRAYTDLHRMVSTTPRVAVALATPLTRLSPSPRRRFRRP